MRRIPLPPAAALLSLLLVVACTGDDTPAPTAPPQLHSVGTVAACDGALARVINGEIGDLYKNNAKSEASARWREIQDLCPTNLTLAQDSTVEYFDYFLRMRALGRVNLTATAWAHHFNHLAAYVDMDEADFQIEAASFTNNAIKYCPVSATVACVVEFPLLAKLRINPGTTNRPVLATIARAADPTSTSPGDCSEENLDAEPYCVRIETTPRIDEFASPYVDLAVCHQASLPERRADRLRLAHPDPYVEDLTYVEIGEPLRNGNFTLICSSTDLLPNYGFTSALPLDSGFPERVFAALGRLAGSAFGALSPEALYATHSGTTSTTTKKLSPWSPIYPFVFDDRFLVPGPFASSAPYPNTVPAEEGQWWADAKAPGALSVVTSTAFPPSTNYVLKLAQAGGNCTTSCEGLFLAGTFKSFPTPGRAIYDVRWQSMQEKSSVKEAPFYARTGPATPDQASAPSGYRLAKLAYKALSSPNMLVLTFNDYVVQGVSWAPGVAQTFTIRVNLYTGMVSFYLNDSAIPATVIVNGLPVTELPYYDEDARSTDQTLGQFTAEFVGIDAGTVYIDNPTAFRRPDDTAPGL